MFAQQGADGRFFSQRERRGLEQKLLDSIWDDVVYIARYTHQDFDKILGRPRSEIAKIKEAIGRLVEAENTKKPT